MVRSFIVFLMLLVVFLAGMLLGGERGQYASGTAEMEQLQERNWDGQSTEEQNEQKIEMEETYLGEPEDNPHLTQKAASALETGVRGFYDLVVQTLYQISSLFF